MSLKHSDISFCRAAFWILMVLAIILYWLGGHWEMIAFLSLFYGLEVIIMQGEMA